MRLRRLLAEPMLHFLLLGAMLFAVYAWRAPADSAGRRIVITDGVVRDLVIQHVAARGREPSAPELGGLIEAYVRDEILYREGRALGLDRDDIVVKRRVRQKIEVMVEEEAAGTASDPELAAYFDAHRTRFVRPAVVTFEQQPARAGMPTLLPTQMTDTATDVVARSFGPGFATALEAAPVGRRTGPVRSEFGEHYIRVLARTDAASPALADVRAEVQREWESDRRQRARTESYARMRGAYVVTIEARMPAEQP